MKKERYEKPSVTVISLETEGAFMQDSNPSYDLSKPTEGTPEEADSKENNVWETNW